MQLKAKKEEAYFHYSIFSPFTDREPTITMFLQAPSALAHTIFEHLVQNWRDRTNKCYCHWSVSSRVGAVSKAKLSLDQA